MSTLTVDLSQRMIEDCARFKALMAEPRTLVMGILNLTPDSFSDGGVCSDIETAMTYAEGLLQSGADIIDIGGESTRPGATAVDKAEERQRVIPIINAIKAKHPKALISIDTRKSSVAQSAIEAGAFMVNDVSGGQYDPQLLIVIAQYRAYGVLMHSQGTPQTMQQKPHYENVVDEVRSFLAAATQKAIDAGVPKHQLWIDPGFGFGKTLNHNLTLMQRLKEFTALGYPVLLGSSRKSFLTLGDVAIGPLQREPLAAASLAVGIQSGVKMVRVHDVASLLPVIRWVDAVRYLN